VKNWSTPCTDWHAGAQCHFRTTPNAKSFQDVTTNITISGQTYDLPAPPLDIIIQVDDYAQDSMRPHADTEPSYAINGTALNQTWITGHSSCISLNSYQWGFSSLLLFCFSILTCLFAIAVAGLQGEVYWYSRVDRLRSQGTVYTDMMDLASELQARSGHDLKSAPSWEVSDSVKQDRSGLHVETSALPLCRSEEARGGGDPLLDDLVRWMKKDLSTGMRHRNDGRGTYEASLPMTSSDKRSSEAS
jgi:hypothetical protein